MRLNHEIQLESGDYMNLIGLLCAALVTRPSAGWFYFASFSKLAFEPRPTFFNMWRGVRLEEFVTGDSCLNGYLSIDLSIDLSIHLSIHLRKECWLRLSDCYRLSNERYNCNDDQEYEASHISV